MNGGDWIRQSKRRKGRKVGDEEASGVRRLLALFEYDVDNHIVMACAGVRSVSVAGVIRAKYFMDTRRLQ